METRIQNMQSETGRLSREKWIVTVIAVNFDRLWNHPGACPLSMSVKGELDCVSGGGRVCSLWVALFSGWNPGLCAMKKWSRATVCIRHSLLSDCDQLPQSPATVTLLQ